MLASSLVSGKAARFSGALHVEGYTPRKKAFSALATLTLRPFCVLSLRSALPSVSLCPTLNISVKAERRHFCGLPSAGNRESESALHSKENSTGKQITLAQVIDDLFETLSDGSHDVFSEDCQSKHEWLRQFVAADCDSVKDKWPEVAALAHRLQSQASGSVHLTDSQLRWLSQRYTLSALFDDHFIDSNSFMCSISAQLRHSHYTCLTDLQWDVIHRIRDESKALGVAYKNPAVRQRKAIQNFLTFAHISFGHPFLRELRRICMEETNGQLTDGAIEAIRLYSSCCGHLKNRYRRTAVVEDWQQSEDGHWLCEKKTVPFSALNEFCKQMCQNPDTFGKIIDGLHFADDLEAIAENKRLLDEVSDEKAKARLLLECVAQLALEKGKEELTHCMDECVAKFNVLCKALDALELFVAEEMEQESAETTATHQSEMREETAINETEKKEWTPTAKGKVRQFFREKLLKSNEPTMQEMWEAIGTGDNEHQSERCQQTLVRLWKSWSNSE